MRLQLSYYDCPPVQRNATGSPASVIVPTKTSHHQRPVVPKGLFGGYLSLLVPFLNLSICFSTVHLADTRPHSPTTRVSHTTFIGSTHATFIEAGHAPTRAYRLLSFPICQLGSHNSCFLIAFFPADNAHAPNPPCIIASAAGVSTHASPYCCGNLRPAFFLSLQTPPAVQYHLFTMDDRTKLLAEHVKHVHNANDSQRNSIPHPSHTHQHHCERCYDYDPNRCRSTVAITLFTFVIVSHHNSPRHPTLARYLSAARSMRME